MRRGWPREDEEGWARLDAEWRDGMRVVHVELLEDRKPRRRSAKHLDAPVGERIADAELRQRREPPALRSRSECARADVAHAVAVGHERLERGWPLAAGEGGDDGVEARVGDAALVEREHLW